MIGDYLKTLRPEQWSKNLIVFAGLIFAREFTNLQLTSYALLAFILFCLASSAVYIINDLVDVDNDRMHPEKLRRPIAAGRIKKTQALTLSLSLMAVALLGSYFLENVFFFTAIICYLSLNILYSFILKQIVILDVMTIAAGFVLRAIGGTVAINVEISAWLVVCTTLLALFMGFGKRRHELLFLDHTAAKHRSILEHYSISLLDQLIAIVSAATIIAYAFYTLSPEIKVRLGVRHLELTIPFVIYGMFRYLYLIHKKDAGGSPARILYTDLPILLCVLLWIISLLLLMYIR